MALPPGASDGGRPRRTGVVAAMHPELAAVLERLPDEQRQRVAGHDGRDGGLRLPRRGGRGDDGQVVRQGDVCHVRSPNRSS